MIYDMLRRMTKRKQVLVQLTDELIKMLDELAQLRGASRSAVVRDAVERYAVKEIDKEKDRRLIEGYVRIPPDDEFEEAAEEELRTMVEEEPW
jgi:metal-responsive CopG/Arc/MetJ family transcriptional regulator